MSDRCLVRRCETLNPPPPTTSLSPVGWSYRYMHICMYIGMCVHTYWRLGGESFRDPNREIDFGFVFVHVSCVRAKLCAMIPLWLGAAKLFSAPAAAPAAPAGLLCWSCKQAPAGRCQGHRPSHPSPGTVGETRKQAFPPDAL